MLVLANNYRASEEVGGPDYSTGVVAEALVLDMMAFEGGLIAAVVEVPIAVAARPRAAVVVVLSTAAVVGPCIAAVGESLAAVGAVLGAGFLARGIEGPSHQHQEFSATSCPVPVRPQDSY